MSSNAIRTFVFLGLAAAAVGSIAIFSSVWLSIPIFVILVLCAWIVPGIIFRKIATAEEKRRDLERRARNFPD